MARTEGPYDLVDMRTGQLLSAGLLNDAGVNVNPEIAYTYHAWYRALTLISQKSAAVPKLLYKTTEGKRGRELATEHTVYQLIGRRANEEQTAFQFWLQMTGHVVSRGNGYAAIHRDGKGNPVELIPMDPDKTKPVRVAGQLWYKTYPFGMSLNAEGYKLRAVDVLHFKGFGFDGLIGYPVWQVAANEIGLGMASRKLEASNYRNSARPSVVLQTDKPIGKKVAERVMADWERLHTGLSNAGKTAILDMGLKAVPLSMTPAQLELAGANSMSLVAISNYTGVPVSKLGGPRSGLSQEQEDRSFINDGLDFHLNIHDDEAGAKLLSETEQQSGMVVVSDRESLLRPDTKTLYDVLRIATAGRAILTPNEARDVIDMPASTEPDADKLLTPLNMGMGGKSNQPTDPTADQPGGQDDTTKS